MAIQTGHTLETRGMYGVIRNPSYLGMLMTSLGWVLAFRSGVGVLLALSLLIPLVARMHAEERMLREHFGAEYEATSSARGGWCRGFIEDHAAELAEPAGLAELEGEVCRNSICLGTRFSGAVNRV